jgi:diguanylate cyclase (GGDEF)-like protein
VNTSVAAFALPEAPTVRGAGPDGALRPARSGTSFEAVDLRDLALDLIQQGLCVFDGQQRLLLFNRRYAEMYNLDPRQLWIGMTLREVVDLRYAAGTGPKMSPAEYASWRDRIGVASKITDTEVVLCNGHVHAIHHEPTAGGGWVATFDDITERRRAERRVRHMAHHDALTELPNRALFAERLERTVARLRGEDRLEDHRAIPLDENRLVAVLFLDLDHFKDVNDTLGHAAGDDLLRQVARRIQHCLRDEDTLARLGGDEFAIMLDEAITSEAEVIEVARRVIEAVSKPYLLDGQEALIGTSIGVAVCGRDDSNADPAVLLRQADMALYRAKAQQRGSYCLFRAGMDAALNRRKDMERDLRRALSERALELFFQPLVTLVPRRIVGAEALARWDHPQYGMVPPSEFIPLAETAGLIPELGAWILRTACSHATKWDEVMLAVNLSPEQLRQPGLVDLVESTLVETGLPARRLELEITEGILLRDTDATVAKLTRLRALGVGIALDDFGTGYSSLSYLRRFPFSKLKVDRSFVAAMMTDSGTAAIVQAIASLGRSLDMRVTVEGIETEAQLEMIRATGCNEAQGYLLGRPCPPQAFEQLLRSDRSLARS